MVDSGKGNSEGVFIEGRVEGGGRIVGGSREVKEGKRGLWAGDLADYYEEDSSTGAVTRCGTGGLCRDCCSFHHEQHKPQ